MRPPTGTTHLCSSYKSACKRNNKIKLAINYIAESKNQLKNLVSLARFTNCIPHLSQGPVQESG